MEQFVADIEPTLVPELEGSWELLEVFFVGRPTVDGRILATVDAYDLQGFSHPGILPSIVLLCIFPFSRRPCNVE